MTLRTQRQEFRHIMRRYGAALRSTGAAYAMVYEAEEFGVPRPESPAEVEAGHLREEYGEIYADPDVWIAGASFLRIAVAADHLASLGELFARPEAGTYAVFVCVRGVFEMCGIAYWLLEPGVEMAERLQRAINDRLSSLQGTLRFIEKGAVEDEYINTNPSERIAEIAQQVEAMGFPINGTGDRISVGDGRPGYTTLVDELVIPGAYSLFSAYSHGEMWTLTHSGVPITEDEESGNSFVQPQVSLAEYQAVAYRTVTSFTAAVNRAGTHYGWDLSQYNETHERAIANINKPIP